MIEENRPEPADPFGKLCESFTSEWSAGANPDFNRFLQQVSSDEQGSLLRRLIELDTGKLTLEIERYGDGLRKSWKDGKIQTVESVLGNFVASLHDWMSFLKSERLDKECDERQRQKAEKRRASVKEKAELEQARRKELVNFVESWEKAERIRNYLSAIESAINSKTVSPPNPETFALWVEWAHWYAGSICPISATRPRNESVEVPDNCSVQETRPV